MSTYRCAQPRHIYWQSSQTLVSVRTDEIDIKECVGGSSVASSNGDFNTVHLTKAASKWLV